MDLLHDSGFSCALLQFAHRDLSPKTTPWAWKFNCAVMDQKEEARKRHAVEQIIAVLKDAQAGISVQGLCRKHGISDATFYKWRTKYAGWKSGTGKKLRQLEEENNSAEQWIGDPTSSKRKTTVLSNGSAILATANALRPLMANAALPEEMVRT